MTDVSTKDKLRSLNGRDDWHTYSLGFKEITFSDGPSGLRHQKGDCSNLGINTSEPATCFPTLSALGATWDDELAREVGAAIGEECILQGVDVLLAPGVNMKRTPLCGRNFEYFSEDPCLAAKMGKAYIQGVQSKGVGACVKHFAANNQESFRMGVNAVVSKRALEEVYLAAFGEIVKEARPWTIMGAYNRLNGVHCCESEYLLTKKLREDWGFDGAVISDWFGVYDITEAINAGLDLEMPSVGDLSYKKLSADHRSGRLKSSAAQRAYEKLSQLSQKCQAKRENAHGGDAYKAHHELARRVAAKAMVLLKNDGALPLSEADSVYFAGPMFEKLNFQGNGSSHVNTTFADDIKSFLPCEAATLENAQKLVYFAGLTAAEESEGFDRRDIMLPQSQLDELNMLKKTGKPVILVLVTGSAVEVPEVNALLQAGFAGQGAGKAIADTLYGKENPGGKLGETYPMCIENTPAYLFGGSETQVKYAEDIFIGYRYYDKKKLPVAYPFGFGLSYSKFEFSGFGVSCEGDKALVSCDVKNVSERDGSEVVEIYAGLSDKNAAQPVRQLRYFKRLYIAAGETARFACELPMSAFNYYDETSEAFVPATGLNTIQIGTSSRDILYEHAFEITKDERKPITVTRDTTMLELSRYEELKSFVSVISKAAMSILGGNEQGKSELAGELNYVTLRNLVQYSKGQMSQGQVDTLISVMNKVVCETGVKRKLAAKELEVFENLIRKIVG